MDPLFTPSCEKAYLAVFQDATPEDWCWLGYEGQKLVAEGTGTGGLEEMIAKVMSCGTRLGSLLRDVHGPGCASIPAGHKSLLNAMSGLAMSESFWPGCLCSPGGGQQDPVWPLAPLKDRRWWRFEKDKVYLHYVGRGERLSIEEGQSHGSQEDLLHIVQGQGRLQLTLRGGEHAVYCRSFPRGITC